MGRLVEERGRRGASKRRRGRACHRILPLLEILDDRVLLSANPIVTENQLPGTPESVWLVPEGQADTNLEGFTTDISVDVGQTISFKVTDTTLDPYEIDIYRIGYYQGNGARLVDTIPSSQALRQNQPAPIYNSSTGEWDAGDWAVSASWTVPATAVSGVYLADLVDDKTGEMNMIVFVVRNDASDSQILFQVDDATWQAYNDWGGPDNAPGASLYTGNGPTSNAYNPGSAYAVSYNRPLNNYNNTSEDNFHDEFFYAEFPMVEWLEENGYNVSYFTDVDADRYGSLIENHQIWIDAGHDEYWSGNEFDNLLAARNAGVDLAFFSGNTAFWKTYYSNSIDGSNTADRTLVCYKETHANAIIDPNNPDIWTGAWADPRLSPPADGGIGQNELTGTFFDVNTGADPTGTPITVPSTDADLPIWRNTAVAQLTPGQSISIGGQVLGYEWDSDVDNAFRPVGEIDMSSTTQNVTQEFVDWGNTVEPETATHSLTEYRASSGALVFSAGTVQWSWGLSADHYGVDNQPDPDPNMQQATVNLFADMGAQPGTLQTGLVPATQTALSSTPPTSAITWPPAGTSLPSGTPVTITGTASAAKGAFVVGVEVSTDGGKTWNPAQGATNWTYTWTPGATGQVTIMSRAVDDTVNLGSPSTGVTVNVTEPVSSLTLFGLGATPAVPASGDTTATNVGVRFTSDISGYITGIRFYKGSGNNGTHIGYLFTSSGTLLASVTFTDETASGWQEADFSTPVAITAGTTYVASYYAPDGNYSDDPFYFALSGVNSGPLHVGLDLPTNPASVYSYGAAGTFPTTSFDSTNYWVDVVFSPTATLVPRVSSVTPLPGAGGLATNTAVAATFNESIQTGSLSFLLTNSNGNTVPATVSYDDSTHTATLIPNAALNYPATYTATISGATDENGVKMPSSVSWSFSTSYQVGTTYSFWNNSTKPTIASYNDDEPIEVGVAFESSIAGTISAIRFYDGDPDSLEDDDDNNTYVVHLWTIDGSLLASANYSLNDDSSLGWQQANFSKPVAIAANTVYVASYYAPGGGYAVDIGYFANSGVTSGPIHALSNAEAFDLDGGTINGNGLYLDKTGGGFPTNTYAGTNYWVDVVFNDTAVSTPPPTVTSQTPASGATNVSTATSLSATFSEPVQTGSISFALKDSSGNSVSGSLTYTAATNTVTFVPLTALAPSTLYTATVSGATDSFGNIMTPTSWSFTSSAVNTIWSSTATPAHPASTDSEATDVGVKFESAETGYVTGIRFYKGAGNDGTHVGYLWSSSGALLASATFTNETATGWQEVNFATPVPIAAETMYIASYYAPDGDYAADSGYFANSGVTSGPLIALSNAEAGGNGVFSYGDVFPASSYNATNYWVDVDVTTSSVNVPPPTVTAQTPSPGATGVSTAGAISATFSEPIQPGTVSFTLTGPSGNTVAGSVTYNGATNTASFQPAASLALATQYTVTVAGAIDPFGNKMSPVSWSFTTTNSISIWGDAATPAVLSANDSSAVNLGVKFESSTSGYVTGIEFYKGAGNTGTHVGYLWTSSGVELASATFTNETATGWQQVNFATPVAIAANTVYVASYYAPNGDYAYNAGYFASSGVTSGPLTALSNATGNGNGVYLYGTGGGFPTSSYNATNYWVDVDFDEASVSVPPPTVTNEAPNGTGASTLTSVSASFSEAIQPATVSFTLTGPSGNSVPGVVSYDPTTNTASFTPNAPLATSTQYTATISGVTDYFGNELAAPAIWSFTTGATATDTIWSEAAAPANPSASETAAVEVGVKFESSTAGYVTGIRFYKGPSNTGTHIGYLWTSTGTLLVSATFTSETATGWQQVTFANPVPIAADTIYIASYYAPDGGYAADSEYFASSGVTSGPLTALSNATGNGNGVYLYGTGGGFPTSSYDATNYWVDVVFNPGSVNATLPTVTAQTPAPGATGVSTAGGISATFSEPIQPGSISFTVTDALGNSVAGVVSYDATTNTAIFTPNVPLNTSITYTATISGATDYYDNPIAAPVSWSFTTGATETYTLWSNTATPATPSVSDTSPVELGVKFESSNGGYVTGIRFYKGPGNTGTHIGYLWTSTGTLLASATFTSETANGWQEVDFATPVLIAANTVCVASYYAPNGGYADNAGYFASSGVTSGQLDALSNAASGGNGVYVYGAAGTFPTNTYDSSNYWVDVVFSSTPPPVVASTTPAPGAVGVSTAAPDITATFNEPVQSSPLSFVLTDPQGNTVLASVAYNSSTNTAALTPSAPLASGTTYTAMVSGAEDLVGDVMTSPFSWSFTTAANA